MILKTNFVNSQSKTNKMQNNRLGFEEFYSEILYATSRYTLPDEFIEANEDFINQLVFDMWNDYYTSEQEVGIIRLSNILEIFFHNYFKFFAQEK